MTRKPRPELAGRGFRLCHGRPRSDTRLRGSRRFTPGGARRPVANRMGQHQVAAANGPSWAHSPAWRMWTVAAAGEQSANNSAAAMPAATPPRSTTPTWAGPCVTRGGAGLVRRRCVYACAWQRVKPRRSPLRCSANEMLAAAMLDRFLDRSVVMHLDGDSYRLRSHTPAPTPCAKPCAETTEQLPSPPLRVRTCDKQPGSVRRASSVARRTLAADASHGAPPRRRAPSSPSPAAASAAASVRHVARRNSCGTSCRLSHVHESPVGPAARAGSRRLIPLCVRRTCCTPAGVHRWAPVHNPFAFGSSARPQVRVPR